MELHGESSRIACRIFCLNTVAIQTLDRGFIDFTEMPIIRFQSDSMLVYRLVNTHKWQTIQIHYIC